MVFGRICENKIIQFFGVLCLSFLVGCETSSTQSGGQGEATVGRRAVSFHVTRWTPNSGVQSAQHRYTYENIRVVGPTGRTWTPTITHGGAIGDHADIDLPPGRYLIAAILVAETQQMIVSFTPAMPKMTEVRFGKNSQFFEVVEGDGIQVVDLDPQSLTEIPRLWRDPSS